MKSFIKLLLITLLLACTNIAYGERFLIIPAVQSIPEIRTAERISQFLSTLGTKPTIFLHRTDSQNLQDKSIMPLFYGNHDELVAALRNNSLSSNKDDIIMAQIKQENILKTLSREKYDTLVCNAEDPICHNIDKGLKIQNRIHLLYNCPHKWSDIFQDLPSNQKFPFSKLFFKVSSFINNLFSKKNTNFKVEYQSQTLYLSQCFQPLLNPGPSLKNVFPVGSFIGNQPKRDLPDAYKKPILLTSKIIVVYLGEDESLNVESIFLDSMKSFPNYFFLIVSRNFSIGKYALGNVVVDENAPLDELLSSNKIAMLISNGEWTILLNALYHSVPSITIGVSKQGILGRQFIREKKYGIDLSMKRLESKLLQETIREIVFDSTYRTNSKVVSTYLKGLNTNYLVPNIIYNFFSAKSIPETDL